MSVTGYKSMNSLAISRTSEKKNVQMWTVIILVLHKKHLNTIVHQFTD